jgi:co-chaperonin GroES (HSP10)
MTSGVAANELIEVYLKGGKASLDSNGQRFLTADDAFVLACRLLEVGMQAEGACPIAPFDDQIIVRVVHETNRMSGGGIALLDTDAPQATSERALRGVVLAVGPKVAKLPWTEIPKVGDLVAFSRNAGIETIVGDKRYLAMKCNYALFKYVLGASDQSPTS